jgi:hypothetical protein
MVGDLIGGAEAVVQAGKLVSTVSQLNPWETVAVIGTIGAFGTSWLRSEIKTILANDLAEIQKNLLESARADKEALLESARKDKEALLESARKDKEALLESARKDKEELRSEINGCTNKTFELALSVIKSPDKSTVTTEYLEKKFVPLSEFQELEERVSKLEDGGGPQIETQEHKIED